VPHHQTNHLAERGLQAAAPPDDDLWGAAGKQLIFIITINSSSLS
jgi:hypothetical protein